MKKHKGFLSIIIVFVITLILWFFSTPSKDLVMLDKLSRMVGGLSQSGLFLTFLLSSRSKLIEKWFNGFKNVYKYHKNIGIFSVVAVFIHCTLFEIAENLVGINNDISDISNILANIGLLVFVILTILAFLRKKLKYENWRIFHRLMVIPYGFGIYHIYASSNYDLFIVTPLSIWVALTSIIGMLSAIYVIFFYQKIGFKSSRERSQK